MSVLDEVAAERARQTAKWGVQRHPDGTGQYPLVNVQVAELRLGSELFAPLSVLGNLGAARLALAAKCATDDRARAGRVDWRDILLEEVFEALAESDPEKLRTELIQVAAVATQWVEAIDDRPAAVTEVRRDGGTMTFRFSCRQHAEEEAARLREFHAGRTYTVSAAG